MPNIVKNTTFLNPLDLLAPHSCRGCGRLGQPLCDCCQNYILQTHQNLCPFCKQKIEAAKCPKCHKLPAFYSVNSRTDLLDTLIHELKYNTVRSFDKPLAEILDQTLPNFKTDVYIVPLPTIGKHVRERGLDHTNLIAKQLTKKRSNFHLSRVLIRTNNSVQVGANRESRIEQAKHAYEINPKIKINPEATYLLFDDVWTTGASMLAAKKKLQQAGAQKIIISVLAVSQTS